ncbi:MAG: hypothetical protein U0326_27835 [Polyangiales bacterium]
MMRRRAMLSMLCLSAWTAACGALTVTGDPERAVFVAPIDGTDAAIGAVVMGDAIAVYVCGGPTRYASVSQWFEGGLDADGAASWILGDTTMRVRREGHALSVSLSMGDLGARALRATRVPDEGLAGLYEATDDGGRVGVIVLPAVQGGDPSVVGAWRSRMGIASQVTPIRPLLLSLRALRVDVHRGATLRALWVRPVTPAR